MQPTDDQRSERLKQARLAAGYSSAWKAAKHFGWQYPTYSQHERGGGIGKAGARYAEAFGVPEGWLLTGEGAPVSEQGAELLALFDQLPPEYRELLLASALAFRRAGTAQEK